MYAITGITGRVGGTVARILRDAGLPVRAIARDKEKGKAWAQRGCEIAIAATDDAKALTRAFEGATGVFLMVPPDFDPEPGFPHTQAYSAAIKSALDATRPGKVVFLSTVGGHVSELTLLNNSKMIEDTLRTVNMPVALLRAAWFMENSAWDIDAAKAGVIPSFLQPFDHPIPMIATQDIGETAAALLRETWTGQRIVELEGPRRYSANDIAAGFAAALGHPVIMEEVPRDTWESLFRSQGMKHPLPRIRMVDGFNEGWIDFEGGQAEHRKGRIDLATVLKNLVRA